MTDIEISKQSKILAIQKIAHKLGIKKRDLTCYGEYEAKIGLSYGKKHGKLILVTAMNPTPQGIGKTTVSIGLADALTLAHKNVCLALREPSLGPVFGIKGGACGGGYSQIAPMEDINLHFTGDFHAITSANNLLCSMVDNHIFHGNKLNLDKNNILVTRCIDMNDRALRNVVLSADKKDNLRQDSFVITAASEVMAILSLSTDFTDLKRRLGNILIAFNTSHEPIYARDIKADEAMAILLKDAIKPNLVQTLGKTPALVHCGPFANIAHGCNSVIATKMAMSYADYVVTEAGFGSDLGAEKFLDIKCRTANISPDLVIIVATIQALKYHAGIKKDTLKKENVSATLSGLDNLKKHVENIKGVFNLPVLVTLNKYSTDSENEISCVKAELERMGVSCIVNDAYNQGGKGAKELADFVVKSTAINTKKVNFCYDLTDNIEEKINKISRKIYGADGVIFNEKAKDKLIQIKNLNLQNLPVVIAKTQYSLSDNEKLINRPKNFKITIRDIEIKTGAEFLVAIAGNIMLMPGLNKTPNAQNMKIDSDFNITGLS